MSFRDVMTMPLRAFWVFNKNIARIQAESEMRALNVLSASQSVDGYSDQMTRLEEEHGTPLVTIDNRRDLGATDKLRDLLR